MMKLILPLGVIGVASGSSYLYFTNIPEVKNELVSTISDDLSGLSTTSNIVNPDYPSTTPQNIPPKTPKPIVNSPCYTGGCSGQICSDVPDMMSTCEWNEQYACYQSATCERQANGSCGWTETPKLTQCLKNSTSNQTM